MRKAVLSLLRVLVLVSLVLPLAAQAQNTQATAQKTLDSWSSWKPYTPPVEADTTRWRSTPEQARDLGLVPPARWLSVDPLAEKHPDWTPYYYVLANPLLLIDPDGRQEAYYNRAREKRLLNPATRQAARREFGELLPLALAVGGPAMALNGGALLGGAGSLLSPGTLLAAKEGVDFIIGTATGAPDPEGFGGGTAGQAVYRGVAGITKAEARTLDAIANGIKPRGTSSPTMKNLIDSINKTSRRANSGFVQASESFDIALEFATNKGTRGGVVFVIKAGNNAIFVNADPKLLSQIEFPEQQIVAFPGGIGADQILGAYKVDKEGNILETLLNTNR